MKIRPGNKENSYWNGQWGKHGAKWQKRLGNKKRRKYYKIEIKKELNG